MVLPVCLHPSHPTSNISYHLSRSPSDFHQARFIVGGTMSAPTSTISTAAVVALGAVFGALGLAAVLLLLEWWVRKRKYGWTGFPWVPQYRAGRAMIAKDERGVPEKRSGRQIYDPDTEAQRGVPKQGGRISEREDKLRWWKNADEKDGHGDETSKRGRNPRPRNGGPASDVVGRDSVPRRSSLKRNSSQPIERRCNSCRRRVDADESSTRYSDDTSTLNSSGSSESEYHRSCRNDRTRDPHPSRSHSRPSETTLVEYPQRAYVPDNKRYRTDREQPQKFPTYSVDRNARIPSVPCNPWYPRWGQTRSWPAKQIIPYQEQMWYGGYQMPNPTPAYPPAAFQQPAAEADWQYYYNAASVPPPSPFPASSPGNSHRQPQQHFGLRYPTTNFTHPVRDSYFAPHPRMPEDSYFDQEPHFAAQREVPSGRVSEDYSVPDETLPNVQSKSVPTATPVQLLRNKVDFPRQEGQPSFKAPMAARPRMRTRGSMRGRPPLRGRRMGSAQIRPRLGARNSTKGQTVEASISTPRNAANMDSLGQRTPAEPVAPQEDTTKIEAYHEQSEKPTASDVPGRSLPILQPLQEDEADEEIIREHPPAAQRAVSEDKMSSNPPFEGEDIVDEIIIGQPGGHLDVQLQPLGGVPPQEALMFIEMLGLTPTLPRRTMRAHGVRRGSGRGGWRQRMAGRRGKVEER